MLEEERSLPLLDNHGLWHFGHSGDRGTTLKWEQGKLFGIGGYATYWEKCTGRQ